MKKFKWNLPTVIGISLLSFVIGCGGSELTCSPHDILVHIGGEVDVLLSLSGFNGSVEIFPLYEPAVSADKITNLGNITLKDGGDGLNMSVTIHAVRGGHVTVYFNATSPEISDKQAYVRVTVIHSDEVFFVCLAVGWIYFAAWSVSFYPQIYENFKRKSVVGLNLDYVVQTVGSDGFTWPSWPAWPSWPGSPTSTQGPREPGMSFAPGPEIPPATPTLTFDVKPVQIPDLTRVQAIPRGKPYSHFLPSHREAAQALINVFLSFKTAQELADAASIIRDQVNEHIFVFAWAAAIIRRPDTRSLRIPPIWEIFPDKFIEQSLITSAQTEVRLSTGSATEPILVTRNFAATDRIAENRVSYFREDIGINSHHWHWHLVYPGTGENRRDRRGELFFYMHQQIIARYDTERLANFLPRVVPFHNWEEPIAEAYFPKLTAANGGIIWGSRPTGLVLKDINIPDEGSELGLEVQVNDLENWRTRILQAIHKGSVEDISGKIIPLDEERGIDLLGDIIEASDWSVNKLLYGDLHNFGHTAICYIHDPDHGHLENMGVMGDTVTAMRDPIFYRWHKFIDSLFQQFKATLQPYRRDQLVMPDISVTSIEIRSAALSTTGSTVPKNTIITGWQESTLEMTRGLDFASPRPVHGKVTHLQHQPFTYFIQLTNTSPTVHEVVFRIFIAPVRDEAGRTFSFREQRILMIEMDKFVQKIRHGTSVIKRDSSESSVTIPFEQTFRELERTVVGTPAAPGAPPMVTPTDDGRNFCGCGWPAHCLVPRGKEKPGMLFTLFVMATNWHQDRAVTDTPSKKVCRNAASYCGILDENYPDKRPMGFPFDRPPPRNTQTLQAFLTPNMAMSDIRIQFEDQVIARYPKQN